MQNTEGVSEKKGSRGVFLSVMIALLIIGDIQIPYYLWINPEALHTIYRTLPAWYSIYAFLELVSNVAIIIGMWKMKKWSVYLLALYFISKAIPDYFYILPDKQMAVFATTIIGAIFWFWAIKRKWFYFE